MDRYKWERLKALIEADLSRFKAEAAQYPTTEPPELYAKIDILERELIVMENLEMEEANDSI